MVLLFSKLRAQQEKNPSQQFVEYLSKRTQVIDQINLNFKENNFANNVNILKIKNSNVKLENLIKLQAEKENGFVNPLSKALKNKGNLSMNDSVNTEATNESKPIIKKFIT